MRTSRAVFTLVSCILLALLLGACYDTAQSPPARSESPANDEPAGSTLAPVDLVYVCGNKFLATNATLKAVQVEYRVVGTNETGNLTLREGSTQDPPHSETELETTARGVVELYLDGERVARRRNEGMPCGGSPFSASVAAVASAGAGEWSAVIAWPVVAMHMNLLPNGRVLFWGVHETPHVWDPVSESLTPVPSPVELFCSGHSFLADGRLLVSGGHIQQDQGLPDNTIFAPESESWSQSTPMRRGRWYPTNTTLANGDVVIMAGRDQAEVRVEEPEVWSSGGIRVLSTASLSLPYYPRTFLAPNGKIFYAGELQRSRYLDPSGTGAWTSSAKRLYGTRDYGAAVMYHEGKILYVGGGRTTNTAEIIDLNSPAPAWQWTGSMAYPRRHLNATVLPTGEVLVTGGSSGTEFNDVTKAVRAAELWNPTTGTWTTLASNAVNRVYHSTSILLPDARVLHAGSGARLKPYERNAEFFSPPYLFKGPRPTITAAPSNLGYGTSFSVSTPEAAEIAKVSLIRIGSATHAFDMNQRFQRLSFTRQAGALTISAPANRNRTPPGHYMLFLLDGDGVPSVAKIVKVGSGPAPDPPPSSISLTVTGHTDATKQYMTLKWTGPSGTTVDVYRDGSFLKNEPNDGKYVNSRNLPGASSYTYKVCEAGTSICSNEATVQFDNGTPPTISLTVTGRTDATKQYMMLRWTRAAGATVDVYRSGTRIINTPNDVQYTNSRNFTGAATYVYKLCEPEILSCSNEATVVFK